MLKPLLLVVKRWSLCFIIILCFLGLNPTDTQAQELVGVEVVLLEAAPNIPWPRRTESSTKVFKGEKFNYDLEENNLLFQKWITDYPKEVTAYRKAMDQFFKDYTIDRIRESEKDFFLDLKAQYQMIKNLQPW